MLLVRVRKHTHATQVCNANSMHNSITARSSRGGAGVLPGAEWSVESEGFRESEVTQDNFLMGHSGPLTPGVSCPAPGGGERTRSRASQLAGQCPPFSWTNLTLLMSVALPSAR